MIETLLADRKFEFPVERAIFASVSHRLCLSGSDRSCDRWLEGYRLTGLDGIDLHHLYRAIAWLGEELADQNGRTRAPRCTKDLIEERLFAQRRDLFTDLDLVVLRYLGRHRPDPPAGRRIMRGGQTCSRFREALEDSPPTALS